MATIELINVEKKFGDFHAVKPLNLTINSGEFVVLLGPSGCGKTTTLRMISGLESVSTGNILFDNQDVTWRHPGERNSAFVFQFFALYSHLTARQNIAFPLEAELDHQLQQEGLLGEIKRIFVNGIQVQWERWKERDRINQQVDEVAKMLRIEHLLERRPGALSGGDQQRIALARALVRRPSVFLMDEPLGALDAEFREAMRSEIKRLHIEQKATTVYVTHDQVEAMAMGDRIVVMSNAVVQQVGTPSEVYHNPSNTFVARFIGSPGMNLMSGQYVDGKIYLPRGAYPVPNAWKSSLNQSLNSDGNVIVGFRPEAVTVNGSGDIQAEVYSEDLYGGYSMLHLSLGDDTDIVHGRVARNIVFDIGDNVQFSIDPEMVRFFDPETGLALQKGGDA
jgi:multiple sugar transport system ATP-binding protein